MKYFVFVSVFVGVFVLFVLVDYIIIVFVNLGGGWDQIVCIMQQVMQEDGILFLIQVQNVLGVGGIIGFV